MTRHLHAVPAERPPRPAVVAAGLLTIALVAGCGSAGSGSVAGPPPTPTASATQTPTPTPTPSPTPSADSLRSYHDPASGISLTVPQGYVVATTAAQAAARFPRCSDSAAMFPRRFPTPRRACARTRS